MMDAAVVPPSRCRDTNKLPFSDFDYDRGSKVDDRLLVADPLAIHGHSPLFDETAGLAVG
jgi:hypothetical protein